MAAQLARYETFFDRYTGKVSSCDGTLSRMAAVAEPRPSPGDGAAFPAEMREDETSASRSLPTPSATPEPRKTIDAATQEQQKPEPVTTATTTTAEAGSTIISNIDRIILSGVTSVQLVQRGPGDPPIVTGVPLPAAATTTAASGADKKKGETANGQPKKKYILILRHKKEEQNEAGQVVKETEHDGTKLEGESEIPVLEAVTVIMKSTLLGYTLSEYTQLKVRSPHLLNALRWVVKQSDENLDGGTLRVSEPYKLLHNYRDDLEAFKTAHPPTHSPEYIEETNSHIDFLLDFLHQNEGGRWQEIERSRWKKEEPTATWKNLWLLLRPGDVMLVKKEDYWTPYVLQWMTGGASKGKIDEYSLGLWNIDYNGEYFGRSLFMTEIKPFDGEIAIRSLKVFPASYDPEWSKLEQQYIERGKKFVRAVSDYSYLEYSGKTAEGARREYKSERVVLDYTFEPWTSAEFKDRHRPRLNEIYGNYMGGKICLCDACIEAAEATTKTIRPIYADLDLVTREDALGWTDEREKIYALCAPVLYGYILKERKWRILDLDLLQEPKFNTEIMDTLVMDDGKKQIIRAICNEFTREDNGVDSFRADHVPGKGSGRIFLLHGPPGVGKTLTAECVAENTRRPLLSITAGDVGITATNVEDNLERFFKWAQDWKAILLLDEADVFLETREKRDLERNSVVSVFLRALEYYSGIMFITTNRIGSFDEAFKSRMHISIHYSGFDDAQRKQVWRNNFNKLRKDKKNIAWEDDVLEFVLGDPEVKKLKWNGRDIRNCKFGLTFDVGRSMLTII